LPASCLRQPHRSQRFSSARPLDRVAEAAGQCRASAPTPTPLQAPFWKTWCEPRSRSAALASARSALDLLYSQGRAETVLTNECGTTGPGIRVTGFSPEHRCAHRNSANLLRAHRRARGSPVTERAPGRHTGVASGVASGPKGQDQSIAAPCSQLNGCYSQLIGAYSGLLFHGSDSPQSARGWPGAADIPAPGTAARKGIKRRPPGAVRPRWAARR
jgi:hypothetical protein